MAIAFLALFSLAAAAVLNFGSVTEAQRGSTEKTAAIDAVAEGSAQFALDDTRSQACGTVSGGTMEFPPASGGGIQASTLTYSVPSGSAGCVAQATSRNAVGNSCSLCLLNSPNGNPSATVLSLGPHSPLAVTGEVDANGSVAGNALTAGAVGLVAGASCSSCSPAPSTLVNPFADPMSGNLSLPTNTGTPQTCNGCASVSAGVYSSINVTGTTFMNSGVYIATGPITISGNRGLLTNSDSDAGGTIDSDAVDHTDSGSGGASDSDNKSDSGNSTSVTTTTLTDSSKTAWTLNQWAGATVASTTHNNKATSGVVAGNSAGTGKLTLTTAGWNNGTPQAGNPYVVSPIVYGANTLTDATKNWSTNQWNGAVVAVSTSGGTVTGIVSTTSSNTLTLTANWSTVPLLGSAYSVSMLGYTANTLTDLSKHWPVSRWVGATVSVTLSNSTIETDTVLSNTANTLTMTANWNPGLPSGGNAYVIHTLTYTANTLSDSTKSWTAGVWNGAVVTVTLSGNSTETGIVASNSSHTLTMTTPWGVTPSTGTSYVVATLGYTSNTLVDTSKSWPVNQWAGSVVTVTLGVNSMETASVLSNTSHTLTMSSPWGTIPSAGDAYSISTAVVIYLACPTSAPYWSCGVGGQSGGSLSTSGQGTFAVTASVTGPYAGFVLLTDPNLIDPSGGSVVSVSGNGGSFGGSIYAPRGSVNLSGGGSSGGPVNIAGRLIAQDLVIGGNGNELLNLTGSVPSGVTYCYYYNDSSTGAEGSGSSLDAHFQFETDCATASSRTSIISFNYGDGP